MPDRTSFLNVDLDISSREDLASLVRSLEPELFPLHVGRVGRTYSARLEHRTQPANPNIAIRRIVSAIAALPARQRACWRRATRRDLDIGIQAAAAPHCTAFALDPETVAMAARVGARIVITVYGIALAKA